MLMGVSSGIEPVFSPFIWRKIGSEYRALLAPLLVELLETYPPAAGREIGGKWDWDKVTDALSENHGSVVGLDFIPQALQQVFVCAHDIAPLDHVRMQGAVQQAFDAESFAANSLSKTINLPNSATVQEIEDAYSEAYRTGCKGITVYRDGSRQFQVLSVSKAKKTDDTEAESALSTPAAEVMGESATVQVQPVAAPVQTAPVASAKPVRPVYERPARLTGNTLKEVWKRCVEPLDDMKTNLFTLLALRVGLAAAAAQPVITCQISNQVVIAGSNVTMTICATGTPPLSYQWRSHLNSTEFTNIPFATAATLVLTNIQPTSRRFCVVVTDGSGLSATSTPLALSPRKSRISLRHWRRDARACSSGAGSQRKEASFSRLMLAPGQRASKPSMHFAFRVRKPTVC